MKTFTIHLSKRAAVAPYRARILKAGGSLKDSSMRGWGVTVTLPRTDTGLELGNKLAVLPEAARNGYVSVAVDEHEDPEVVAQLQLDGEPNPMIVTGAVTYSYKRGSVGMRGQILEARKAIERTLDMLADTCLRDVLEPAAKLGLQLVVSSDDTYFKSILGSGTDTFGTVHWSAEDSEVAPWYRQQLMEDGLDNALDVLLLTLPNGQVMAHYIASARRRGVL